MQELLPEQTLPPHEDLMTASNYARFAGELGYTLNNGVHPMTNWQRLRIN